MKANQAVLQKKYITARKTQKLEPEDEARVDPRSDRTREDPESTTTTAKKRKRLGEDGDETRSKSNILNVDIKC
ncbi:unnamed protein product [Adineta steineri]|uniref:Uncharacterized protein n=1 Tax=Adineta steineri TaxID=433720 RepID=A0A819GQ68_9BILA|nr:unnamed protein product [Adineta steineri]CAF3883374.1 unnamed protein product [Adineta steineri]